MIYSNYTTVKLGKSLSRLKQELIASKKLLTKYVNPIKPTLQRNNLKSLKYHKLEANEIDKQNNKHVLVRFMNYIRCFKNINPYANENCNSLTIQRINNPISHNILNRSFQKYSASTNDFKDFSSKCSPSSTSKCDCTGSSSSKNGNHPGRYCYHKESENAVNQQILIELNACYAYLSMACYFGRTEVALPGCQRFFMRMHEEEHDHALDFINYQILRGGIVQLQPLTIPECQDWKDIQFALSAALEMEKTVEQKLISLYNVAEKHHDLSLMDMIAAKFMHEQERSICEMARLLLRAKRMGCTGVGEFLFDKEMHKSFARKENEKDDVVSDADERDSYI